MSKIVPELIKELKKTGNSELVKGDQRFFKEKIISYGHRTAFIRKLANEYYKKISHLPKEDIFKLCEELLQHMHYSDGIIAFAWARKQKKNFKKSDFKIFERWLKRYVHNWAWTDDFCTHTFGDLIHMYPELIPQVKKWTKSKNRWVRRASAVIFIGSTYGGHGVRGQIDTIFDICLDLLEDKDNMVQKGYGWLLKDTSRDHQKEVFDFVMKHKSRMPRTSLRYAIEKMPDSLKKKAMRK